MKRLTGLHGSRASGVTEALLVQNTVPELTEHWRHVVYACYQPRCFAREEDLRLKAEAWEEYRVTTHWPARNVHLFPKSQPGKGMHTLILLVANIRTACLVFIYVSGMDRF